VTRAAPPPAARPVGGRAGVGRAVRLEVQSSMPHDLRAFLLRQLELDRNALFALETPLDIGALAGIGQLGARRSSRSHPLPAGG